MMKQLLLIKFSFILLMAHGYLTAAEDYLSEALRQQVEALKHQQIQQPTRPQTYTKRAKVLWDWANTYALTGRSIPVNMTTAIRPVLPNPPSRNNCRNLDFYLEELVLLDEEPNAIGSLEADLGPFEARSFVSFQQHYTVGERAIKKNGGFLIARHFMPGYGVYQVDDPSADNYVTIQSNNPQVEFVADETPMSGMHGAFRGTQPALFFRVPKAPYKKEKWCRLLMATSLGDPGDC